MYKSIQDTSGGKKLKCKGICYRFAAKKPLGGFRFAAGQRPCSVCGIFVDSLSIGIRCPCCNNKLRLNSRNTKSRKNRFNLGGIMSHDRNLVGPKPGELITVKLVLNK